MCFFIIPSLSPSWQQCTSAEYWWWMFSFAALEHRISYQLLTRASDCYLQKTSDGFYSTLSLTRTRYYWLRNAPCSSWQSVGVLLLLLVIIKQHNNNTGQNEKITISLAKHQRLRDISTGSTACTKRMSQTLHISTKYITSINLTFIMHIIVSTAVVCFNHVMTNKYSLDFTLIITPSENLPHFQYFTSILFLKDINLQTTQNFLIIYVAVTT